MPSPCIPAPRELETPREISRRRRLRPEPPSTEVEVAGLRAALPGQVAGVLMPPSVSAYNRAVEAIGFEKLWTLLSGAPWAEPYIAHLARVAETRFQANPSLPPETLLSDLNGNESLCPLKAGTVVVLDLNGFSNFQNNVSQTLRQKLDGAMQTELFDLGKDFGVSMLQMPAGDQYSFFLEKMEDEEVDNHRLAVFLKRIEGIKISTGISQDEMHRYGLDPSHYPDGNFTFSTGVRAVKDGEVMIGVFQGPAGSDQGYTAVFGKGWVEALHLQKSAGKGTLLLDAESQAKRGSVQETFDFCTVAKQAPRPGVREPFSSGIPLGVVHSLHARGSLSSFAEAPQTDLGITAIGIGMGHLDDLAESHEKYAEVARRILLLLNEPRFRDFYTLKQDGETLHILCRRSPRDPDSKVLIRDFCLEVTRAVQAAGLPVQVGVDYAKAMLETAYRDCLVRDRSNEAIVHEARLCHAPGFVDGDILFGGDYLREAGNRLEWRTLQLKGGPIQYLKSSATSPEAEEVQELIGRQEMCRRLAAFVHGDPKLGNVSHLKAPGKGYGRSALLRYARNTVSDQMSYDFPRIGGGDLPHIRGFLAQFLIFNIDAHSSDEEVNEAFLLFLKRPEEHVNNCLLLLDHDGLSTQEQECFFRLAQVLPGTSIRFIHTGQIPSGSKFEFEFVLEPLPIEEAAKLILEANRQYSGLSLSVVQAALRQVSSHPDLEGFPFTPRNLIHAFAPALRMIGGRTEFLVDLVRHTSTGELGARMRSDKLPPYAGHILGVLARVRAPVHPDVLWEIYESANPQKAVGRESFDEALNTLSENYLLVSSTGELALTPEHGASAEELFVPGDEEDFSLLILEKVYQSAEQEVPLEISEGALRHYEAELHHLLSLSARRTSYFERSARIVEKLGAFYLDRQMNTVARRLYQRYYIQWLGEANPGTGDIQLYMDMAWTFLDTRDPLFLGFVQNIYRQLEPLDLSHEQRLEVIWRRFRLLESRGPDATQALPSDLQAIIFSQADQDANYRMQKAARLFDQHTPLVLKAQDLTSANTDASKMLLWTLKFSAFFQKVVVFSEHLEELWKNRDVLIGEYHALLEGKAKLPEGTDDFAREMQARVLSMKGRVERHLIRTGTAIANEVMLQKQARQELSVVKRPEGNELRRYETLSPQARVVFVDHRLTEEGSSISREIDKEIVTIADEAEKLEVECALAGDANNRRIALVQQMNAIELFIRAIAAAPQDYETDEVIQDLIERYMNFARITVALDPRNSLQYRINNLNRALAMLPADRFTIRNFQLTEASGTPAK